MPPPPTASPPPPPPEWEHFASAVRGFVGRRIPDRDADDVTQDVFVRLHSSSVTPDSVQAWVFAVARNTIADYHRQRSRQSDDTPIDSFDPPQLPSEPPPETSFASWPGDHDVHEEVLTWLRPFAEALPEHDRLPLVLADFEGLTQRELAERLGLTLSGAKSRVQRARRRLAQNLVECCDIALDDDGRVEDFRSKRCGC